MHRNKFHKYMQDCDSESSKIFKRENLGLNEEAYHDYKKG